MTPLGTRAWRWLAGTVATLAIVSALGVVAFRLALGLLPEYEGRVADTVRAATGLGLSFDSLDARIGRYGPEIYFEGARIVEPGGEVLVTARAGRASLSLLRSAWFRRLEIGRVVLESPRLNLLIFADRHIELVGQAGFVRPPSAPRDRRGLDRVPRGVIEVRNATVGFRDLGTDGATWEVTQVDLELRRKGDAVSVDGQVRLPARLGRVVAFDADVRGDLADLVSLDWRARMTASDVDLAGWRVLLPGSFALPTSGTGSFRLSARGSGRELARARAVLQLAGVALPAATPLQVTYSKLAGDVLVERDGDDWRVTGRGLEFSLPGSRWRPADVDALVSTKGRHLASLQVRADFIKVENLLPLLALAPVSPAREKIERLALRGSLSDIDLRIVPAGARQMPDLTGRARFEDFGFAPVGRFPGVTGVDGRFEGAGPTGLLWLESRDVVLDWPLKWRSIRPFKSIRGRVELARALGGVRIASDDAVLESDHGEASGRVRLLARPGETPLLDLRARASVSDLAAVAAYLPHDRLSSKALAWIDAAFPAGRITRADVELTGPVRGFPYREGQGSFHAVARAEGATVHFADGWQPVTGVAATAEFDGPSLKVVASTANIGGIAVRGATAEVADFRESILVVRADAAGDAGSVKEFFATSPLAPRLGAAFARLTASGPVEGEVVMYLPIKQFADRVITVRGMAAGVNLALDGLAEPLTGLAGEFWVRNREFHAPRLRASLLGHEAELRVASTTRQDGDVETTIEGRGTLDASRLPRIVRLPLDSGLAGDTSWRGSWTMNRPAAAGDATTGRIRIDSDLSGMASGLPAPLDKRPDERRPLRLELDMDAAGLRARAGLGRSVNASVEFRRGERGLQISRGAVRLGGGEAAALPVGPGLRIDGRTPYLSVSALTQLRWKEPSQRALQDLLAEVDLDVGRLEVLGYEFDGVSGRLHPGNRAWDVDLSAATVQGRLRVPYDFTGDVPLVADLDRLKVSPQVKQAEGEADPRKLPGMRVDVRDLVFLDWRLGHLTAQLQRGTDGVGLEQLSIRHAAFDATGQGAWRVGPAGQQTSIRLQLDSRDMKGTLEAFALAPVIEARRGRIEADVSWPRGPDAHVLERMSGRVGIAMSNGRLLSVEPGAGRILGLMSLSHVGKRLSLDFEDVTGQGLAFDSVKGDFALTSGEAFTDNLMLRGATAEIGIAGRTSLKSRTYDQTAVVTGDLSASLGVAGALAGGPAVGAAMLLFSQIFKEPLKGVARAYYRISGPWEDPIVKKIDARKLQDAAGIGQPQPGDDTAGGR